MKQALSILIIIALTAFIWFQCEKSKDAQSDRQKDNERFQERITSARAIILSRDTLISIMSERVAKDRVKYLDSISGLKRANVRLTKKLSEARVNVQNEADSLPDVSAFVEASDSLLKAKDAIILTMEINHNAAILDMDTIIQLQTKQLMEERAVSKMFEERLTVVDKSLDKAEKKVKLWKWVSAGAVAVALYVSVKD